MNEWGWVECLPRRKRIRDWRMIMTEMEMDNG